MGGHRVITPTLLSDEAGLAASLLSSSTRTASVESDQYLSLSDWEAGMLDEYIDESVERAMEKLRWNEECQRWESDDGIAQQF